MRSRDQMLTSDWVQGGEAAGRGRDQQQEEQGRQEGVALLRHRQCAAQSAVGQNKG